MLVYLVQLRVVSTKRRERDLLKRQLQGMWMVSEPRYGIVKSYLS